MKHRPAMISALVFVVIGVSACQRNEPGLSQDPEAETETVASNEVYESPGAPNVVPIDVKYRLLDTPAVGQPLRIERLGLSTLGDLFNPRQRLVPQASGHDVADVHL